ncbi:hypothetical protein RI129_006644 [Pyrocoelia pectoralis]|uniref:Magnesium transporter n=1 Tax=Pyrocoelia pectoralis TaxID=417401 RepID=A0AAN7VK28_9COLE
MVLSEVHRYWIGFCVAILANIVIAVSDTIRKKAIIRRGYVPPENEDKYVHVKDSVLWISIILLIIGEIINFIAFTFGPTFLVASVGVIAIFITAILWKLYYGENFNCLGWLGLVFSILGLAIMAVNFPRREISMDILELASKLDSSGFIYYVIAVVIVLLVVACYIVPFFGSKCGPVYVIFSLVAYSLVGSIAVVMCKCSGYSAKYLITADDWADNNVLYTALFIVVTLVSICIQEFYMAKFTNSFTSPGLVKAIFFILRTALVGAISNMIFEEWSHVRYLNIVGTALGFVLICIGVLLHPLFSDYNFDQALINEKFQAK